MIFVMIARRSRAMSDIGKFTTVFVFVLLIFGVAIYSSALVWTECRQTNSFLYCVKVVGR